MSTLGQTQCTRFNTSVESTLAVPMKEQVLLRASQCPNNKSTTAQCTHGQAWTPPYWALEGMKAANKELVQCHHQIR